MGNFLSSNLMSFLSTFIGIASTVFIFLLGAGLLYATFLYVKDRCQTKSTILRNYPLIGRFRFLFEKIGEFLRQYFFAMDREELPFNRAQRSWVYRAAKNIDSTVAFGSTKDLRQAGAIIFINAAFPSLEGKNTPYQPSLIGPFCK
ncbi:MAG: FMN-binding glutamate synthase family protein, partial [Cycloclasticus sp.]|nr:FMN-binding glutamate synthase family protein [Cycloclasticus sp.]